MSRDMSVVTRIKCGARSKQNNHAPCRQPAMKNARRCRLHGGKSTGPKTPEGKQKAAYANYKHGLYTNDAMIERKMVREMLKWRHEFEEFE